VTASEVRHPGELRWETRLLAVVTGTLVAIGIAACYAAGSYRGDWYIEAQQQVGSAVVGGLLFLLAARLDYRIWKRLARPMFYATVAGLAVIAVVAVIWRREVAPGMVGVFFPYLNGAHRWIRLWEGGPQVQVAAVARVTLPILVAAVAADLGRRIRDFRGGFVPVVAPVLLTALLVAVQPNLSMAILLTITGLTVAFVAGVRISHVSLLALGGATAAGGMLILSAERMDRLRAFLGPAVECVPVNDQVCDSLIGFGNGGVVGLGFGQGTQKLGHIAYGYSDFILSVIGEEWGFIGVVFLVVLFALFCWTGFRIARTAPDAFGNALAGGLTTMIGLGAFMHAAVVTKLMPATGLTLPFISAGRVALVINLLAAGILMSIGRQRGRPSRRRR
jgi:cell division protein FtsW